MKNIVQDSEFLKNISPQNISRYLDSAGWNQEQTIADKASIWILRSSQDREDDCEILLPLRSSLQDYTIRLGEVFRTLSVVENRPAIDILNDINNFSADIIRIRVEYPDVTDNTISLSDGVRLFDSTKQLIYAISSSVIYPKPFFQGGRFKAVTDYMEKLRIGQTEPGSYIIKIISPISNQSSNNFEREVIITLFKALNKMNDFPENIEENQQLIEIVDSGISANFCQAILNMSNGVMIEGLQFNLSCSKFIGRPSSIPSEINIHSEIFPKLKKANEKLKSKRVIDYFKNRDRGQNTHSIPVLEKEDNTEVLPTTKIQGNVIRLEWGEEDRKGRVAITTSSIQNKEQEMIVELGRSNYIKAFEANLDQRQVVCTGHFFEEENQLIMRDVRRFSIV